MLRAVTSWGLDPQHGDATAGSPTIVQSGRCADCGPPRCRWGHQSTRPIACLGNWSGVTSNTLPSHGLLVCPSAGRRPRVEAVHAEGSRCRRTRADWASGPRFVVTPRPVLGVGAVLFRPIASIMGDDKIRNRIWHQFRAVVTDNREQGPLLGGGQQAEQAGEWKLAQAVEAEIGFVRCAYCRSGSHPVSPRPVCSNRDHWWLNVRKKKKNSGGFFWWLLIAVLLRWACARSTCMVLLVTQ